MTIDPQETLRRHKLAMHASQTIKAFLEWEKSKLTNNPDSIPGLRIGKGQERKSIPGSAQSWERLTDLYDKDLILSATKWTPASLSKAICPGKGQKATREEIEANLFDLIEVKHTQGQVELTET